MHISIATLTINLQLYYKLFHINQRGNVLRYLTCLCMQSHASLNDGHSHIFYYFIYCDNWCSTYNSLDIFKTSYERCLLIIWRTMAKFMLHHDSYV